MNPWAQQKYAYRSFVTDFAIEALDQNCLRLPDRWRELNEESVATVRAEIDRLRGLLDAAGISWDKLVPVS